MPLDPALNLTLNDLLGVVLARFYLLSMSAAEAVQRGATSNKSFLFCQARLSVEASKLSEDRMGQQTSVAQKSIRTQKQTLPKGGRESVDPNDRWF